MPHLDSLLRTARALTANDHDARDLVQAACLKALESFGRFRPGSNFKAWMMRIMRNAWIDRVRHRKIVGTELSVDETLLPSAAEPSPGTGGEAGTSDFSTMLEQFSDQQVISTLMELPEMHRMALFLSDVEGLSQEEVAEVLGVAVGTVKSRVSRARAMLREKLEDYAREMGFLERRSCRT